MSDWEIVPIGDVADFVQGLAINAQTKHLIVYTGGMPLLRIKDLIESNQEIFIDSDNAPKGCIANEEDLIMTRTGQVGFVFMGKKGVLHNNSFKIVPKSPKVYLPFIYWFFNRASSREYLTSIAAGSVQPDLTHKIFKEVEIPLPPLQEQRAIAEVLNSIAEKIQLLKSNNKTLEEMSETLYKKWFMDIETDSDTRILNIDDVAIVQNGYSFKSTEFVGPILNAIEVLKMGHISAEGGLRSSPKKDFVVRSDKYDKWVLNKRDIILAMTDMKDNVVILGVPALIDIDNKYVLNQRVGRIYLKENSPLINILILFMQMKDKLFIGELQAKANSGVQVNLGTDTIRESQIVVPSISVQQNILPHLIGIQDKLDLNREEIHKLEQLKDTLLPKLMSGQVIVKPN